VVDDEERVKELLEGILRELKEIRDMLTSIDSSTSWLDSVADIAEEARKTNKLLGRLVDLQTEE
jgi:hypothetical protein